VVVVVARLSTLSHTVGRIEYISFVGFPRDRYVVNARPRTRYRCRFRNSDRAGGTRNGARTCFSRREPRQGDFA